MRVDGAEYVPARWQRPGRLGNTVQWIVMHVMVAPEKPGTAEAVARYFERGDRKASAHVSVDNDSVVRSVLDHNTAFAAAGANTKGFHVELAGYPDQSGAQWRDPYSDAMLARAAVEAARVASRYQIPPRPLFARDLQAGVRGFTTHAEIEKAWPSTGHWDPGPHFPMAHFLRLVEARPLLPSPTSNGPIMTDCVAALRCSCGGYQKLQADGGVFNQDCAHFHGSYFTLPAQHRNVARQFADLVRLDGTGYAIVAKSGEMYEFAS